MYGCSLNADVFWEIGWAALRIYGVDHKQEYNKEWNWAISNFYYFIKLKLEIVHFIVGAEAKSLRKRGMDYEWKRDFSSSRYAE